MGEHETQACKSGGAGENEGENEGEEQERWERQDEVSEGPQAKVESGWREQLDANGSVVYPKPTLLIAVAPNCQIQGQEIIDKHGATDFVKALHVFLKKHPTWDNIPSHFLPTVHHHFPVWNRLYLHHHPLLFDPEHSKRDVIRARPPTHSLGPMFDVALVLHRNEAFGLGRDIYLGINIISGEEATIKLESVKAKHPQLKYESKVYETLADGVGVPFV
ncbi:serine/threonine protein kinase [Ceratobasidium sp. 414]|nr:serine/threonine protein kinase [Ceratobasidium sp. 414]